MTTSVAAATPTLVRSRFSPSFFFWMTAAMCVFVFAGFGMHSFLPALRGDFPPAPPVVALLGLLGMLVGEQLPPLVRSLLSKEPALQSWHHQVKPHVFGHLPRGTRPAVVEPSDKENV